MKSPYRAVPLKSLLAELEGRRVLFLGDAALPSRVKICSASSGFTVAHPGVALQRAGSVGLCAFDIYESGERQDVYSLEPFYLRETQAERVYAEKQRSAK